LTAMKYGVYALMAVIVGVMLVGMLPGQLSNLATPTHEISTLQGASKVNGNITLSGSGSAPSRFNDSTVSNDTAFSISRATGAETAPSAYNSLADGKYYGMMGLGFIVALTVYFVAKRML
jgi:hypothetical protein